MKISDVLKELTEIQNEHGDLDVYAVQASHEYLVSTIGFNGPGPLEGVADLSQQEGLPERAVLELKMI